MYSCLINIILVSITISLEKHTFNNQDVLSQSHTKRQNSTFLPGNILCSSKKPSKKCLVPPFTKKLKKWTNLISRGNSKLPDILTLLMRDIDDIIDKAVRLSISNTSSTEELDTIKRVLKTSASPKESSTYIYRLDNTSTLEELKDIIFGLPKKDILVRYDIFKKFIYSYFGFKNNKEESFYKKSQSKYIKDLFSTMSDYDSDRFEVDQKKMFNITLQLFNDNSIKKYIIKNVIIFFRGAAKYQRYHNVGVFAISTVIINEFFYEEEIKYLHMESGDVFRKIFEYLIYPGKDSSQNGNGHI